MKKFLRRDPAIGVKSVIFKLIISFVALGSAMGMAYAQNGVNTKDQPNAEVSVDPATIAALEKRVKSLEAQIVDLRAMIGTFASMDQRPDISGSRQSGDRRITGSSSSALPWRGNEQEASFSRQQRLTSEKGDAASNGLSARLPVPPKRPDIQEDGFISDRLVSANEGDRDIERPKSRDTRSGPLSGVPVGPATIPDGKDAQGLYKDAYAHMLRRDYASAQSAFGALIKNHPQSRMAGNAQYWLGETFYVRGKYRPAADAFLKAYRDYPNGVKAPDSLMKLALSLARLGQKGAACKTFNELDAKFPNAPNHVKQRAGMEQRRAGCK
jgi:tol-pal system protein YbgF